MIKNKEEGSNTKNEERTYSKIKIIITKIKKIKYSKAYKITLLLIGLLIRMVRSVIFPIASILIVVIIDGYVFVYGGLANGFRALVAEGTISLALVTYLQMKNAKNQTKV